MQRGGPAAALRERAWGGSLGRSPKGGGESGWRSVFRGKTSTSDEEGIGRGHRPRFGATAEKTSLISSKSRKGRGLINQKNGGCARVGAAPEEDARLCTKGRHHAVESWTKAKKGEVDARRGGSSVSSWGTEGCGVPKERRRATRQARHRGGSTDISTGRGRSRTGR